MENFCLYYVSPLFRVANHDVILLGEKDKWVPASPNRISLIYADSNKFMVFVNGVIGEKAVFSVAINNNVTDVTCDFANENILKISYAGDGIDCNRVN